MSRAEVKMLMLRQPFLAHYLKPILCSKRTLSKQARLIGTQVKTFGNVIVALLS
jgi:hypothetical protein